MIAGKLCMQEWWVEFSLYFITGSFCSQTFKSTMWEWQSLKFVVLGIGLPFSFT
jgi:hypothetical protein